MADAITPITANPDTNNPAAFPAQADLAWSELKTAIPQMNAAIAAFNLNDVQDVSTTSITIGAGNHTFTVSVDKSFQRGQCLVFADAAAPSANLMQAIVIDYSFTSLTVTALQTRGSGTVANWIISLSSMPMLEYDNVELKLTTSNGRGSTNTLVSRFTTTAINTATDDITYADSATLGATFTMLRDGWYAIRYVTNVNHVVTRNSATFTGGFTTIPTSVIISAGCGTDISTMSYESIAIVFLAIGDIIRAQTSSNDTIPANVSFSMKKISLSGVSTGSGGGGGGGGGDDTQTAINAGANKTTPADADKVAITDSAAGFILKTLTWANVKAAINTYLLGLDYVRVNANKDLLSGSGAVVTQASTGMRFTYRSSTALTDPGGEFFNFSTLTPTAGATVSFVIDHLDKNGTDMSSYMDLWESGGTIYMRSAAAVDVSFAVISITTISNQDPDTYFSGTGTFIGGNAFTANESCTIQYVPPTDVASAILGAASKATPVDADKLGLVDSGASNVLKHLTWANLKAAINTYLLSLNYVRVDSNGNLLNGAGTSIDGVNPVYALVSKPVTGVTALPAASSVTNGTVVAIHPDCFVDGGNLNGILMRSYLTGNVWRPAGDRALLYSKMLGTLASPTVRMTNTVQASSDKFAVPTTPIIPANLLYSGCKIIIRAKFRRNMSLVGLGNVTLQCWLGTSATQTSNSLVWNANINDTDDYDMCPSTEVTFTATTTVRTTRNVTAGGTGLASSFNDLTAGINTAADMNVTWRCLTTLDANNSIDLLGYDIWMEAQ